MPMFSQLALVTDMQKQRFCFNTNNKWFVSDINGTEAGTGSKLQTGWLKLVSDMRGQPPVLVTMDLLDQKHCAPSSPRLAKWSVLTLMVAKNKPTKQQICHTNGIRNKWSQDKCQSDWVMNWKVCSAPRFIPYFLGPVQEGRFIYNEHTVTGF